MNALARRWGVGWLTLANAFTCASVMSLGCTGKTIEHPSDSTGGSSNIGVGGSASAGGTAGASSVSNGGSVTGGTGTWSSTATCFTPTQDVDNVHPGDPGGCPCSGGASVCVNGVGFICMGHWEAVWDGPCMPTPSTGGASSLGTGGRGAGGSTPVSTQPKWCGARAGNTCTTNEYCAYEAGQWCGAADAEAVCKPRPQSCTKENAPVCGCDGKTYSNACVAASEGAGVYATGECTS